MKGVGSRLTRRGPFVASDVRKSAKEAGRKGGKKEEKGCRKGPFERGDAAIGVRKDRNASASADRPCVAWSRKPCRSLASPPPRATFVVGSCRTQWGSRQGSWGRARR